MHELICQSVCTSKNILPLASIHAIVFSASIESSEHEIQDILLTLMV